jgi:hypothetical protein
VNATSSNTRATPFPEAVENADTLENALDCLYALRGKNASRAPGGCGKSCSENSVLEDSAVRGLIRLDDNVELVLMLPFVGESIRIALSCLILDWRPYATSGCVSGSGDTLTPFSPYIGDGAASLIEPATILTVGGERVIGLARGSEDGPLHDAISRAETGLVASADGIFSKGPPLVTAEDSRSV